MDWRMSFSIRDTNKASKSAQAFFSRGWQIEFGLGSQLPQSECAHAQCNDC
jgi:hypothetical protein